MDDNARDADFPDDEVFRRIDLTKPYVEPEWKFSIDTVNGVDWLNIRWPLNYVYEIELSRSAVGGHRANE